MSTQVRPVRLNHLVESQDAQFILVLSVASREHEVQEVGHWVQADEVSK